MNSDTLLTLARMAIAEEPYPEPMFPPSPYYRFLRLLAGMLQPALSVELGVCGGGGSLHLALGNPKGRVIGVDYAYDHPDHIRYINNVCPNFSFYLYDSIEAAMVVGEQYGEVGILFVDTVHTYERTLAEFAAWHPYLAKNAIVCFDDLFRPGMAEAWAALPGNKIRIDALHDQAEDGGGFGVLWLD